MKIKEPVGGFAKGYNAITEIGGKFSSMLMNFGILELSCGQEFSFNEPLEKVVILLSGSVEVSYCGKTDTASRKNCFEADIYTLNVDKNTAYTVRGTSEKAELAIVSTENDTTFDPHVYDIHNTTQEVRGEGTMEDCGRRIVRTSMDKRITPHSNIMFGEDVHYPGRWAGFPSHSHDQPEVYFYKFAPKDGFGLVRIGDEGELLEHNDTITIEPNLVHPQVAAPGYAMYFLWVIRHLKDNPYLGPDFEEKYLWTEKEGAKYWPDIEVEP